MPTREELHELVNALSEEAFERAASALRFVKDGPPKPPPPGRDAAFARMQERMRERHQAMLERFQSEGRQGMAFVGGGSGGFRVGPGGKQNGRYGFGYMDEDGTQAYENSVTRDSRDLRITERLEVDEAQKTMTVRLDLLGPDGTSTRFDHTFGLPEHTPDDQNEPDL
jgi:hypothetical protein